MTVFSSGLRLMSAKDSWNAQYAKASIWWQNGACKKFKGDDMAHSPTLDTLRMIEKTIRDNNGELTKTAVWKALPNQMQYQTYKKAIDYFLKQNKITLERDNRITWIHYPALYKKLMEQTVPSEAIK